MDEKYDEIRNQIFWGLWLLQIALLNTNFWWGLVTVAIALIATWKGGWVWLRLILGLTGVAFIAIGLQEPLFPVYWIWEAVPVTP